MSIPTLIQGDNLNLSEAWLEIFEKVYNGSGKEISPLVLTLTDFSEDQNVKNCLNKHLIANNRSSIETVSETIFPDSLYKQVDYDREKLYSTYIKSIPKYKAIEPSKNGRGLYFERLINFSDHKNVNQIEIIIDALNETKTRRSKLQAAIFDPTKDHINDAYQKFPCLQHVTFYKSESDGLIINSFYAIQSLYQKAYGNWLGLINLGKFVARECGIELERFNCFIGVEQLEINKAEAKILLDKIKSQRILDIENEQA